MSDHSSMCIDEIDPSILDENELPNVDDGIIANSARRIRSEPWKTWTEVDKTVLMDHVKYHMTYIERLNKAWASGLTSDPPPKKPESDVENLIKKGRKRRKGKVVSTPKKAPKAKSKSISKMTDDKFNEYLLGKRINNVEKGIPMCLTSSDLVDVGIYLENIYTTVKQSDSESLLLHVNFGKALIEAKKLFDIDKRKNKTKQTWADWVRKYNLRIAMLDSTEK